MTQYIAFLRGVNVGRAKRIAMADLRALMEELGFSDVRTVLNSGNVIFQSPHPNDTKVGVGIERAITRGFGFPVPVIVVSAKVLSAIVEENPLPQAARDPSRYLVAFVADAATLARTRPMLDEPWSPEAFALGSNAAYLWCPNGVIASRLMQAFGRRTGDAATTRNWATVLRLQAAATAGASTSRQSGGRRSTAPLG